MFISETQMADNSLLKLQERPLGIRWFGLPRPGTRTSRGGRIAGGIGFMVFNKRLQVRRICQNHNGALMVEVKAPQCRPCAIIGVYNPPVTSRCNSDGYEFSRSLLNDVGRMYAQAQRSYEVVLLVGDSNLRLGSIEHLRASSDERASNDKKRSLFIRFCQQLDVLPLHGRCSLEPSQQPSWRAATTVPKDASPALCTSKDLRQQGSDNYATEVDYILGPRRMRSSDFRLGQAVEGAPGTHRPIYAFVRLTAWSDDLPQQQQHQRAEIPAC